MVMSSLTASKKVLRVCSLSLGGSKYFVMERSVMFVVCGGVAVFVKKKYLASHIRHEKS